MTRRSWHRLERAMPWLVAVAFIAIWQLAVSGLKVSSIVLPSPLDTVAALLTYHKTILRHAMFTLQNTALGFGLAIVLGLVLGVAIGASRLAYAGLYPLLIGLNSVPKVAITPILVLWLGIGEPPAIATACLLSIFPIIVNVATGIATMEPEMEDLLRSFGASKLDVLTKVGLPRAMPYFFASLKISITLAFVGAVLSETIASNEGIGYLMLQASTQFRVPLMFAALIVIGLMGVATYLLFAVIERRTTGWATRNQHRTEVHQFGN
ncbi:ABC transporter permease [Amorphus sp. 3PC139-8]|uniref:ABC transporter permease n=1 Tax=Amorphus sp. 3PC139-8 TaxID=2735676 RepID=UPI00345C620E